jgi:GTP cyclohydrolase IA
MGTEQGEDFRMIDYQGDIQGLLSIMLKYIGDQPYREGLKDTPARIVRSWKELYSGYRKDPVDVFTVFESDGYDQMVILKDIEFFSTCEHHLLPFFGKAYIAYIPNNKIIGISKLARLLEIYSRRLQIQERIGKQVTDALDKYLEPKGSACILKAKHLCVSSRGVQKQHSEMVTSSVTGVFRDSSDVRNEFLELIK